VKDRKAWSDVVQKTNKPCEVVEYEEEEGEENNSL
jgi:hypothetical protein